MTLQTLTGPSIREALADARRLFGPDVVLLQSAPAVGGDPASVTVAFDVAPAAPAPAPTAPAAASTTGAARVYGYGAPRKRRPAPTESVAAALLDDLGLAGALPPAGQNAPAAAASPAAATSVEGPARQAPTGADRAEPATPSASAPGTPEPAASAAALAALQARLADLEAALEAVRPVPAPARPPVVFVGPAGDGKSSLALGLARAPALAEARCPAAIVVASEGDAPDAAARFWTAGVPAAVVRTADEVRDALRTFADADLLVVDTPALSLDPARATAQVARLGALLAPLGAVEVVLAVSAARSHETLAAETLDALGLRPDALALTRLDEVADPASEAWTRALALPLRFVSAAPGAVEAAPAPAAADGPPLSDIVLGPLAGPVRTEATSPPLALSTPRPAPASLPDGTVEPALGAAARPAAPAPYWRPLPAERARTIAAPPSSDLWALVAPASTLAV
ncbi:hypothetical protein [Rubrivirga sp. IMCC45206]|uniref:hypothetical protein n=1 Tax=Rubrivirga sp. IMCC45206 TaxID=3391614 RepID=UPI00398FE946